MKKWQKWFIGLTVLCVVVFASGVLVGMDIHHAKSKQTLIKETRFAIDHALQGRKAWPKEVPELGPDVVIIPYNNRLGWIELYAGPRRE